MRMATRAHTHRQTYATKRMTLESIGNWFIRCLIPRESPNPLRFPRSNKDSLNNRNQNSEESGGNPESDYLSDRIQFGWNSIDWMAEFRSHQPANRQCWRIEASKWWNESVNRGNRRGIRRMEANQPDRTTNDKPSNWTVTCNTETTTWYVNKRPLTWNCRIHDAFHWLQSSDPGIGAQNDPPERR